MAKGTIIGSTEGWFSMKEQGMSNILDEGFHISFVENPEEAAWGIIGRGVGTYNKRAVGGYDFQRLCFVLRAPDQEIVGGVIAETYWEWLYIDLLWVKEEFRGRGYGHRLLMLAEEEAIGRGVKHAYLDTFSFQAPKFYKARGYKVFGKLHEFPPGHQRFFMKKQL